MTRRRWLRYACGSLASSFVAARAVGAASLQYLVLDANNHRIRRHWQDDSAIPFGSLLKPFLALAYGRTHNSFPAVECRGTASQCWLASGHGRMTIAPAIETSCNAYFLAIAAQAESASLESICVEYQLAAPARGATPRELIGLRSGWPQRPETVLRAFARLVENRTENKVQIILEGMRLCAAAGTAKGLDLKAYAKTGTAPCSHTPAEQGDGYVAVAYPNDVPRMILLAQQHNTTGAHTAILAGELLRREFGAVASPRSS